MPAHAIEIITVLAVAFTWLAAIRTAMLRAKLKIQAPATVGHPDFERAFRVHLNTVENLVLFLPLLWLGALMYSMPIAFYLGIAWLVGRIVYMIGYNQTNAERRGPGAIITMLSLAGLLIITVIGLFR